MIKMLWTEKYRPKYIRDVIGQDAFVMDAESWVEVGDMPNVLLFGNAGLGKTAGAYALARTVLKDDFNSNFIEVNASDDRRLETVRTKIKEVASTGKIGEAPFRIILLDEMDGMTNDAQNALKRLMERYSHNVRFIITCNERNRIIYPIQSRCANYLFSPLSNEKIATIISNILQSEGIDEKKVEGIGPFIASFNGDVRRSITELQAAIASDKPLKEQTALGLREYENIISHLTNQELDSALTLLHELIYAGRSMKDICNGLHDVVMAGEFDHMKKYKLLRIIGEGEWRSMNMTPRVLASWMAGQMI